MTTPEQSGQECIGVGIDPVEQPGRERSGGPATLFPMLYQFCGNAQQLGEDRHADTQALACGADLGWPVSRRIRDFHLPNCNCAAENLSKCSVQFAGKGTKIVRCGWYRDTRLSDPLLFWSKCLHLVVNLTSPWYPPM